MRQGFQKYSNMRQAYFLNSTCDMAINKRQRHVTLSFLKIDRRHEDPPSRAPTGILELPCEQVLSGDQGPGAAPLGRGELTKHPSPVSNVKL